MNFPSALELPDLPAIPVHRIHDPLLKHSGMELSILRLDLLPPVISGNKWFKLKYNLLEARRLERDCILSFGGPWSNHLHALARAGQEFGFRTVGIVRSELSDPLNPCLQEAVDAGMVLEGMSRSRYRHKQHQDVTDELVRRYGPCFVIPEGGANLHGVLGCAEIPSLYSQADFDMVCMACGTGTMLAGMATSSLLPLVGFQVLRGEGYMARQVGEFFRTFDLSPLGPWSVAENYHGGGYARVSSELMAFLTDFQHHHGIPLEPVYSGKLLYGIYQAIKKRDIFPRNSRILAVHGGGLQGVRGFQ